MSKEVLPPATYLWRAMWVAPSTVRTSLEVLDVSKIKQWGGAGGGRTGADFLAVLGVLGLGLEADLEVLLLRVGLLLAGLFLLLAGLLELCLPLLVVLEDLKEERFFSASCNLATRSDFRPAVEIPMLSHSALDGVIIIIIYNLLFDNKCVV